MPPENGISSGRPSLQVVAQYPGRVRPTKRACVDCHSRKVKCDGASNGFPCSNCKNARIECMVAERRKRKRQSEVLSKEVDIVVVEQSDADLQFQPTDQSQPADQDDLERPINNSADYDDECELAKEHLVEFFNQDLQYSPIRARSTYVGTEFSNLNYLTHQRTENQHVYHYPCSNIYVPRVFRNSQTPATPNLIPKDAFVLPPRHVSDVLITDYFKFVHPGLPIIDKASFEAAYYGATSPSILLLQAICLVGSHVSQKFKNFQDLKVAFFRRAKALLDGRYEEDRMIVVQAALLLTWFSDGGDDICANAWYWIGIATRTAIGLGMHRDALPSQMPESDKRIWRRIWWCVVQFDCLVSLIYGRPQTINFDDCDVAPLSMNDFDDLTNAQFVIQHSKLCEVISELVRSRFSVRAKKVGIDRKEALVFVDTTLAQWLTQLPEELKWRSSQSNADPWVLLLHLTYNTALTLFHRPRTSDVGDFSSSDETICSDSSTTMLKIFEELRLQSGLRYCWFWAPSCLFTAMLQISGEMKCQNPILLLQCREKYDSGLLSLRKMTKYWLFATSILRLFQYSATKPVQTPSRPNATIQDLESPLGTASSLGAISNSNIGMHQISDTQQEMNWTQLLSLSDSNLENMNVENNRWLSSLNEWQSLYWSDPLTNIRLDDSLGDFHTDWPP